MPALAASGLKKESINIMTLKKLDSLFKSAGIYTLTNIINSAIPFLLLPVFTRYLTPYDYGIVATFQILISFIAPFIGLSLNGAISVKYYDKSDVCLPKYISNCIAIVFTSTIILSFIFWLFAGSISTLVAFPAEWLWSIIIVAFGQFLVQVALAMWQIQMKPVPYGIFQLLQTTINILLALVMVVAFKMGWQGRIIAQICCDCGFGTIALFVLYKNKWLKFEFDNKYVSSALKYGVPLIPHAVAGWTIAAIDRVFISKLIGVADTGVYTVGYQIAMIIGIIEFSFNNAWVPWLFHNLSSNDYLVKLKIVRVTYVYVIVMISLALLLSFTAPLVINILVGKQFYDSVRFIFWLALGRGIYAMYFMTCNYLLYRNRTVLLAFATVSSAAIHSAITYVLIKANGAVGAAQAGVISTLALIIMTWYFANKIYPMPWRLKQHDAGF